MNTRTVADRILMAEYIADQGAVQGDELRAAMEWRMERFLDAVYGETDRWFQQTIDGWDLTEQGHEALLSSLRLRPRSRSYAK